MVAVLLLLCAWTAWFTVADIALYAVSDTARIELDQVPSPIESPVEGIVASTTLTLGRQVNAGDVLVSLDVRTQVLDLDEQRVRLDGLSPQVARLRSEMAAAEATHHARQAAAMVAEREARARAEEAGAVAALAASSAQRTRALAQDRLVSDAELARAEAEVLRTRAAADAAVQAAQRIGAERAQADAEHRVQQERLERELVALQSQAHAGAATVARLQHQQGLRHIVAPVSGILAEVAPLPAGRVLHPGDAIATILPAGQLHVVAQFAAAEAFGRVRRGQAARLRLDGFPPAQYGAAHAVVSAVSGELRQNRVRVELALRDAPPGLPLQHGLPGAIEVEVERLSPARLAMRAVGRRMAGRAASGPS